MNTDTRTGRATRFSISITDFIFVALSLVLGAAHLQAVLQGNLYSLLFVIQNAAAVIATVVHRPPADTVLPLRVIIVTWAGVLLPLLMHIPPESPVRGPISLVITALGSILATTGIVMLGRSFAIEPGNRGIRTTGLYRIVRHPIYAAYLFSFGGILIAYPSWWNAAIYVLWIGFQVQRIRREEQVLSRSEAYRNYAGRVRFRLVPGVW